MSYEPFQNCKLGCGLNLKKKILILMNININQPEVFVSLLR